VTVEDCQLLETMNKATKEKYAQMSEMTQRLMKEMSNLQNSCKMREKGVPFYEIDQY
jgi:hypothetical protein